MEFFSKTKQTMMLTFAMQIRDILTNILAEIRQFVSFSPFFGLLVLSKNGVLA